MREPAQILAQMMFKGVNPVKSAEAFLPLRQFLPYEERAS